MAVSAYTELDIVSPPDAQIIELLDCAYDQITSMRRSVSPEDFTVYVFSLLLVCCRDEDEMAAVRSGARVYMADVVTRLSRDIAILAPKIRALHGANERTNLAKPETPVSMKLEPAQAGPNFSLSDIRARRRRMKRGLAMSALRSALRRTFWILVLVCLLSSLYYIGVGELLARIN